MNLSVTDVGINTTNTCTNLISYKPIGNIIDRDWYENITTKSGRPDLSSILTFSEIVYWYRPKTSSIVTGDLISTSKFTGDAWQTSYAHFKKKFGFSHETTRRALVKLEKLGAIRREFRNIKVKGQIFNNVMFIHLGENIHKFLSFNNDPKPVFLNSNHEYPYPHKCGDRISNKINKKEYKSRSNESNFIESILEEEVPKKFSQSNLSNFDKIPKVLPEIKINQANTESTHAVLNSESKTALKPLNSTNEPKTIPKLSDSAGKPEAVPRSSGLFTKLKSKFSGNKRKAILDFHPLNQDDADLLGTSSGREFSLSYINKLILKLGKASPGHGFYTKTLFLKYMTQVLANELRQESIVNNEAFRFKADAETNRVEKYLSQLEDDHATDKVSQLRKKLVAAFDQNTAYRLLVNCKFREIEKDEKENNEGNAGKYYSGNEQTEKNGEEVKHGVLEISTHKNLELSEHQGKLLLDQIKSVYGDNAQGIKFVINAKSDQITPVKSELVLNLGEEGTLWHKVSTKLLEYYGEGLHRSWFSKLELVEDKNNGSASITDNANNTKDTNVRSSDSTGRLVLKAPSNFIKDWISSNYLAKIKEFLQYLSCDTRGVEVII